MAYKINHANIKDWAANYDGEPFDAILCDPPYELGFMGKSWDSSGIAFDKDMWADLFRILKPGGHLLAFSGSRTYHRMAVAIEDAGFEIRDMIEWVYGSGFPKSLNIGKQLDKQNGQDTVQHKGKWNFKHGDMEEFYRRKKEYAKMPDKPLVSEDAKYWEGYGTALKPAHEPCVLARKPLEGTVANNVLKHGTGGLNIDGTRVGISTRTNSKKSDSDIYGTYGKLETKEHDYGRFPANLIHDGSDEVVGLFPNSKGGAYPAKRGQSVNTAFASGQETEGGFRAMGDSGSAARFFKTCEYSLRYDTMSVCEHTSANIVAKVLMTIQATPDLTAPLSAVDLQDEQLDQNVRSATTGCQKCTTLIAQELVRIKSLASSPEGLQAIQECTEKYKSETLNQNLVEIVKIWANTDITPTTTNLLTLFGSVLLVIDENTSSDTREKAEQKSEQSRFLYTAKASKSERNAGLEGLPDIEQHGHYAQDEWSRQNMGNTPDAKREPTKNNHPTVKPLSLTKYLANLIKPPVAGRLLVPFSGSGSEMIGALQAGWEYVEGVELTEEYIPIAEARIKHWLDKISKEQMELL